MKWIGMICVLVGSLGLSYSYYRDMTGRCDALVYLQRILHQMEQELEYSRSTLPQMCLRIGEKMQEPYKSTFVSIYTISERDREIPFSQVWREQITILAKKLLLKPIEISILTTLFEGSKNSGLHMQKKAILLAEDSLASECVRARKEREEKGKVILSLGITGGLVVSILFL